ncbi:MAG: extracellular solute-binding protein [Dorea sp.]
MKKRLLSMLLVVAMVATMLVGCGGGSEEAAEESSGDKTTLTFWCHENEPWIAAYEAMAEKFEAANPEYDVEVVSYPFNVYGEKIQTALTASTDGPDIIALWGGMAPAYIESDGLAPVPDELAADIEADYMEPTIGVYKKEGVLYGVAMEYNLEYGGMIVNKNLFDEAGISYPTTWDELRKVSQEVSEMDGAVSVMEGFEMMDGDSLICNYLAMILQQGGQYLNEDGSINFATPEGITALEEVLSMIDNGETDLENLVNGEYCFNDVYQGKGYMASVGSWGIGEGAAYDLTFGEDYEYVAVPQYGEEMAFAAETGWGLIVPKNSADVDGAWSFVEFFIQPENLVEHNIACSQLPPRKSMLTNETYIEAMPSVTFLLDILPNGQWMGPYNTSAMREIFNNMFIDLCEADKDGRDVEGALAAASEQITKECKMSYSME